MTRWIILAHGDSDGVSSAAVAYAYLKSKGYEVKVYFTHPAGLLEDIEQFVKIDDHLIVVDIAINELHCDEILDRLEKTAQRTRVIYIDHHPFINRDKRAPINVTWIHDTCCSASELTYRFFEGEGLDPEYSRIALYGAIGDYLDETPWVKKELDRWDKRSIYLEAGILIQGLEGSRKDHEFKRKVVEHLSGNHLPSTLRELSERALKQSIVDEHLRVWVKQNILKYGTSISYVINPPGSVGRAANYARIYGATPVGIALEERKDIFVMSLRAIPGIDLNRILREMSHQLGIHGGGHPQAAGARVEKDKLYRFLKLLESALSYSTR